MINVPQITWVNNSTPNINAENMNSFQQCLEEEVASANRHKGKTNISKENTPGYPKGSYIVTKAKLQAITQALQTQGVQSSGLFENIPSEILQCGQGASAHQNGAIECEIITGGSV